MLRLALAALFVIAIAGCAVETTATMPTPVNSRVTVERIAVIEDNIAYNARRGVYIIRDTETGKEYIGVSGIGISETSAHTQQAGKTRVTKQDER